MRRVFAVLAAIVSAFFAFYFIRLLVVTGFLFHLREGGGGAYAGAVAFPLIAGGAGWAAVRLWRRLPVVDEP
jgi:Ni,Fe-hydrogenase I cytochrome b subunit